MVMMAMILIPMNMLQTIVKYGDDGHDGDFYDGMMIMLVVMTRKII